MVSSKISTWIRFRPAVLGIALLLVVTFLGLGNASAATTHYISKSLGSDSNNGTSKSTPWAHVPGMIGCSSGAACTYTPQPGDNFILYGGDTWVAADLGINTCPSGCWNGTSGSPISITVDKTWYTGGSWTRPIFNLQNSTGTLTGGAVIWLYSDYWVFDNIEITGYQQTSGGATIIVTLGAGNQVQNNYIHGWSRTAGSSANNSYAISTNVSSGSGGAGSAIHDNVIDGSDSPNLDFMGGILHGVSVYNNVIRYVYNGFNGVVNDFHGNLVEYNYIATSGDHCNMVFPQNVYSGTTLWLYNNVVRDKQCGTTVFTLANANNTNLVAYQYNNVLYDNQAAGGNDGLGSGGHDPTGIYYDYNNTVVSTTNCFGNGEAPATKSTTNFENNHCVAPTVCVSTGTTCKNLGGNLQQAIGTTCGQSPTQTDANCSANFDQYTASATYAYSPVASTNTTVGAGNNLTSLCSGNLAALCNDTTYATYDSVNHVVVMRATVGRPGGSAAWNIGAYQYAQQGPPPNPPTALTAVVH